MRKELRWRVIELDLDRIEGLQHTLQELINPLPVAGNNPLYKQLDALSDEHKKLLNEQQEIEMFLIENEATGWTST